MLAYYSKLWLLAPRESIRSRAFDAHGITAATLQREGVDPKPEILEFFALVSAALALGVVVAAHNASFDVGRLNHTAHRHNECCQICATAVRSHALHYAQCYQALRAATEGQKGIEATKE